MLTFLARSFITFLLRPFSRFPIQDARAVWSSTIFRLRALHTHFMPPLPPSAANPAQTPRVILYHQTHYHNGEYVSLLPLLANATGVTHVIVAAIHLNDPAGNITLNNDPYDAPKHDVLWDEVRQLRAAGVSVLGMLGGAAKGSFARLDRDGRTFEAFYRPLEKMVRFAGLDGLDLDVEEDMSLPGIIRLIDRLKSDFGSAFVVTLAPVATALVGAKHLSGFSYFDLEKAMGRHVSWYNVQFYCGWGSAETTEHYDAIMACGWPADKVVLGLVTNERNGAGWVFEELLFATVSVLRDEYKGFGGVMGWEYFNARSSLAGGEGSPWLWAKGLSKVLGVRAKEEEEQGRMELRDEEKGATQNPFLQIVDQGKKG